MRLIADAIIFTATMIGGAILSVSIIGLTLFITLRLLGGFVCG